MATNGDVMIYTIKKDASRKGNKWLMLKHYPDGTITRMGYLETRKQAVEIARLLAGRCGEIKLL